MFMSTRQSDSVPLGRSILWTIVTSSTDPLRFEVKHPIGLGLQHAQLVLLSCSGSSIVNTGRSNIVNVYWGPS